jgi:hypothetical protein
LQAQCSSPEGEFDDAGDAGGFAKAGTASPFASEQRSARKLAGPDIGGAAGLGGLPHPEGARAPQLNARKRLNNN